MLPYPHLRCAWVWLLWSKLGQDSATGLTSWALMQSSVIGFRLVRLSLQLACACGTRMPASCMPLLNVPECSWVATERSSFFVCRQCHPGSHLPAYGQLSCSYPGAHAPCTLPPTSCCSSHPADQPAAGQLSSSCMVQQGPKRPTDSVKAPVHTPSTSGTASMSMSSRALISCC